MFVRLQSLCTWHVNLCREGKCLNQTLNSWVSTLYPAGKENEVCWSIMMTSADPSCSLPGWIFSPCLDLRVLASRNQLLVPEPGLFLIPVYSGVNILSSTYDDECISSDPSWQSTKPSSTKLVGIVCRRSSAHTKRPPCAEHADVPGSSRPFRQSQ
jgi:hypothetical protein